MNRTLTFGLMALGSVVGLLPTLASPALAQEPKALYQVEGKLTNEIDKEPNNNPFYFKVHTFKFQKGHSYQINVTSKDFRTNLTAIDPEMKRGDISGINPKPEDRKSSYLVYTAEKEGDHQVQVKGGSKEVGAYTLTVLDVTENENAIVDFQINHIYRLNDSERKRLVANLQKRFTAAGDKVTPKDGILAEYVAKQLEYYPEEAATYEGFAKIFAASKSPVGEAAAKRLENRAQGRARFLGLTGKTLEFQGTTTDGKPWDLKDQKGKVVLMYFWYAGSGVRADVKKAYEAYAGRLVVVGLNVDKNAKSLENSLKRANDPWPTLTSKTPDEGPLKLFNDLAVTLGGSMPYILIDAEGKVVTSNANVIDTPKLLEKLLGPLPEKK